MIPMCNLQFSNFGFKIPCINYDQLSDGNQVLIHPFMQNQQVAYFGFYAHTNNFIDHVQSEYLDNPKPYILQSLEQEIILKNQNHTTNIKQSIIKIKNQHDQKPATRDQKQGKSKYLKKNTESNISNQVLAFLMTEQKSEQLLLKICHRNKLDQNTIIPRYYNWMGVIKNKIRKYVSKKFLRALSVSCKGHLLQKQFIKYNKIIQEQDLQIFCKLTRIMMRIYLNQYCQLTVLTSKKIHKQGILDHLIRRRQIKNYLEEVLPNT